LACCWAHLWKIPVTLFQWKPLNVIT
jgi:hypothetical protein